LLLGRRRILPAARGGAGIGGYPAGPDSAQFGPAVETFFFAIPFSFSIFYFSCFSFRPLK
jgi:hypothetical protein